MSSDATTIAWIGGIAIALGLVATNPDDPGNTAFKAHMRAEMDQVIRSIPPRDIQTVGCQVASVACRELLLSVLKVEKQNFWVATVYRVFVPRRSEPATVCLGIANRILCGDLSSKT